MLASLLAILLALISGVGSPLLGSIVFCFATLVLRALGRGDLVSRLLLPIFLCVKLVPLVFKMGDSVELANEWR